MEATWQHLDTAPDRVIVGARTVELLADACDALGMHRVVVVTGRTLHERTPVVGTVERALGTRHAATYAGMREHVPATAVEELATLLDAQDADGVVSVGGGSPIDGAKAAVHHRDAGTTPHLAIPTTLSAAEFSPSAGITDPSTRVKGGVSADALTPRCVVLDAELTRHTPARLWLSTGIRALDHAVETVYAEERDELAAVLALEAIVRLRRWLPASRTEPHDIEARTHLQVAAWWSILGLSTVRPQPSHPLGRLLGPLAGVGHGITSCVLLPSAIEHVARKARERVAPLARAFDVEAPEEVAGACRALIAGLGLPTTLREAGIADAAVDAVRERVPAAWGEVLDAAR